MFQPKRKSVYKVDFAKEFQGIKKGKDDYHAHCIPCKDEINLAAMGKTAIKQHQEKPKHKENAKAAATTRSLSNFMSSRSALTTTDDKTAAAEGAWAFHVATHNQSFSSTDCCSSEALFRTMFSDSDVAKNFSCGQNKTKEFYTTVIEYIDKWFRVELLPTNISWIMLSKKSVDYYEIVEMAEQVAPEIAKLDALFNEVAELNHMLQQIPDEIFGADTAEMKWHKIFKDNDMLPCLYKLVSIILSIQVAKSPVPL
uniref:Uncharacterized protein n=1 Tax=Plectus sambesii TaxID=2011161 RepID=A0A914UJG5_9BILA